MPDNDPITPASSAWKTFGRIAPPCLILVLFMGGVRFATAYLQADTERKVDGIMNYEKKPWPVIPVKLPPPSPPAIP